MPSPLLSNTAGGQSPNRALGADETGVSCYTRRLGWASTFLAPSCLRRLCSRAVRAASLSWMCCRKQVRMIPCSSTEVTLACHPLQLLRLLCCCCLQASYPASRWTQVSR